MARIAISYRRADSAAMAGRIFDRLVDRYGESSVFMDIDSIPPGFDFRDKIGEALAVVDVVVAVIGQSWLGRETNGRLRIGEATDVLRIEIETALKRKIPVIPVLIDGAPMPQPEDLPESIRAFAYYNAAEIDSGRDFRMHLDRLIADIDAMLAPKTAPSQPGPLRPPPVEAPPTAAQPAKTEPRWDPAPRPAAKEPSSRQPPATSTVSSAPRTGLPSWIPFTAFALVPGIMLVVIYFAITIDGTLPVTVLHGLIALVLAAGAGFVANRRLLYFGGRSAGLGIAIGLIGMFVPWIYQLQGRYAAMPYLTGAVEVNALIFACAASLAALSGNLWAQFAAAGGDPPRARGTISATAIRRGLNEANILSVAAGIAGLAALIVEYAAWFPYCRAFGLLDYCT